METEPPPVSEPVGSPDDIPPVRPKVRGRSSALNLPSVLAVALASLPLPITIATHRNREVGGWDDRLEERQILVNNGRRTEKDAIALTKAETKRQRKVEKRKAQLKA